MAAAPLITRKRCVASQDGLSSIASSTSEPQQKRLRTGPLPLPPPTTSAIGIDLFTYFRKLPHDSDFDTIFKDRVLALALFRSLENVEKIIVLRILSLPEPSRWEPFLFWLGGNRKEVVRALNSLCSLHILVIRPQKHSASLASSSQTGSTVPVSGGIRRTYEDGKSGDGGNGSSSASVASTGSRTRVTGTGLSEARYELHHVFRKTLWAALHAPQSFDGLSSSHSKTAKHCPTKHTLHAHAASQWNNILRLLCEGSQMHRHQPAAQAQSLIRLQHNQQPFSSSSSRSPVSSDLVKVLRRLQLIPSHRDDPLYRPAPDALPNETFQWLLLDIRSQILSILVEYLYCLHFDIIGGESGNVTNSASLISATPTSAEKAAKDRTEVLCILFALSEVPIGQPCAVSELSSIQVRFLSLAYDTGLIWMYKPKDAKHYFTTPFAKLLQCDGPQMTHLTSAISTMTTLGTLSEDPLVAVTALPSHLYHPSLTRCASNRRSADYPLSESNAEMQTPSSCVDRSVGREVGVTVESNFKVFAHTASSLLMTVVARLCDIRVVTPNLVIGTLSRESFLDVYKTGVTAEQIIRFFSTHAHPSIYAKSQREDRPIIPENVTTQLKIWEAERRRVRVSNACVFEFSKESDLDIFPLSVTKATSAKWILMNTAVPSSTNPSSPEFQDWKGKVLEKFKERPLNGELQKTPFAVLAVKAQHKEEMTSFIRSCTRHLKR